VEFVIRGNKGYLQIKNIDLANEGEYACAGTSFSSRLDLEWTTHLTVYGEFVA